MLAVYTLEPRVLIVGALIGMLWFAVFVLFGCMARYIYRCMYPPKPKVKSRRPNGR